MFINKSSNGKNNLCGNIVANQRKMIGKSQRELADALQLLGLDVDKNAVQRIEAGKRFEGGSILDIAPTVVNLLGLEPDDEWEGKSLV